MLAKYGFIQLLGKFLPGMLGFITAAILTRILNPEQYGVYGLAMALAQLVSLGAFGWLGLSVTRLATGHPEDPRFVSSVLVIFAAIATAAAACGAVSSLLPAGADKAQIINAAVFGSIVFAYFDLKGSFYTAAFDFFSFLLVNLARAGASAVVAVAVAYYGGGGLTVFLASSAAMLVVCLLSGTKRSLPTAFTVDLQLIRRICSFGLPIAGSLILFAISGWTDRVILDLCSGAAAVGFYTAATIMIQNTLQLAAQAIGSAAYPLAVVAYERGGRVASDRQLKQNFIALLAFLLPAATGLCMLAPNIAEVLVGQRYRDAVVGLTPLLAGAAVISGIRGNFVDHFFQLTGNTWRYMSIAVVMAGVNVVALLLLVPRYGYMGAGVAGLATAAAGLAHALVVSRRIYRIPFPLREVAKVLGAVLAMALVLSLLVHFRGILALCVQIGAGVVTCMIAALSLNLLNLRQAATMTLVRWLATR